MTRPEDSSRRAFLAQATGVVGSGWFAAQWPACLAAAGVACSRRDNGAGFAHIEKSMAITLEAMAEQIIPADEDSAGAREAGVIWFIDAWMGGGGKGMVPLLQEGSRELDVMAGGEGRFADLPFDEQTATLEKIQSTGFFSAVRFLTIVGMFAMPAHGGNRDRAGWKLIGFEDRHAWQPPFGHYDAKQDLALEGEPDE
jgi:hypothetical protein